jgi:hypothetical protein
MAAKQPNPFRGEFDEAFEESWSSHISNKHFGVFRMPRLSRFFCYTFI